MNRKREKIVSPEARVFAKLIRFVFVVVRFRFSIYNWIERSLRNCLRINNTYLLRFRLFVKYTRVFSRLICE